MAIHNLELSAEQDMILETVHKFAQDKIEPKTLDNDEHAVFVRDNFAGLAELGMLGIPLDEADGGAEMGLLSFAVVLEELGRTCGSTARLVLSQTALCGLALAGNAAAEDIATGEKLGAFVGLDSGITASEAGDKLTLSGKAPLVTAAVEADIIVVAAKTADGETVLCLVDAGSVARESVPALGFRASGSGRIGFDDVAVETLARGAAAEATLDRVHIAACIGGGAIAVGMAAASRAVAANHAGERIAFGKPLARQQAVALKLADSRRATEAARHLVYHAARLADAGMDARAAGNMAKLAAVEAALLSSDEAIQILGGYGFTVEYHAERHYRDAKTLEVFGGGSEALRNEL